MTRSANRPSSITLGSLLVRRALERTGSFTFPVGQERVGGERCSCVVHAPFVAEGGDTFALVEFARPPWLELSWLPGLLL